jgi:hypothetical protein
LSELVKRELDVTLKYRLYIGLLVPTHKYKHLQYHILTHLTAQNIGLHHVARGRAQALEYLLLRTVLFNYYLLILCSDIPEPREINFRS